MKSIFLTGSSGFIGNNFILDLKKNYEIFRFKRNSKININQDVVLHLAGIAHDIKNTIDSDPDDADGYYKLSVIYFEKENYLKSFLELTNAIVKKKSFPDYFVLDFDGVTRIELVDMYIKRAEISNKLNSKELMCDDYNMALNLIEDNLDSKNKVDTLISENCN